MYRDKLSLDLIVQLELIVHVVPLLIYSEQWECFKYKLFVKNFDHENIFWCKYVCRYDLLKCLVFKKVCF